MIVVFLILTLALGAEALDPVTGGLQLVGLGFEFLEGLRDVDGFDALEVGAARREETVGHGGNDAVVDKLLYPAGIAEVGLLILEGLLDSHLQGKVGLGGEDKLIAL